MKTEIIIKGQVSGNSTLKSALLLTTNLGVKSTPNGFIITYRTKKCAVEALASAFNTLKRNEPMYYKQGGISYARGVILQHDASKAEIY